MNQIKITFQTGKSLQNVTRLLKGKRMPHLVFSPGASLLGPHWLVSPWERLSSPGWSFVGHGDQVRSEVLEKVQHLTEEKKYNAGYLSGCLSVWLSVWLSGGLPFSAV